MTTPAPTATPFTSPLTNAQRLTILNSIASYSGATAQAVAKSLADQAITYGYQFNAPTGALNKITGAFGGTSGQVDQLFIDDYNNVLSNPPGQAGFGGGPTTIQTTTPDLNPWDGITAIFTNGALWTRVAEFGIGFLLIGIAISAGLKATTGIKPPPLSPVGAIRKVAVAKKATGKKLNSQYGKSNNIQYKRIVEPRKPAAPKPAVAPSSQYSSKHSPSRVNAKAKTAYQGGKHSAVDLSAPIL